jgi:hypothetical protein
MTERVNGEEGARLMSPRWLLTSRAPAVPSTHPYGCSLLFGGSIGVTSASGHGARVSLPSTSRKAKRSLKYLIRPVSTSSLRARRPLTTCPMLSSAMNVPLYCRWVGGFVRAGSGGGSTGLGCCAGGWRRVGLRRRMSSLWLGVM